MAIENKRKQRSKRLPSRPPKFSVGSKVRVKYGISDPDYPDMPLGGWAGKITEVDRTSRFNSYLIEWNQTTLENRHPIFKKRCERDGLEDNNTWLAEEDLEVDDGNLVPLEQPIKIITRPLSKNDRDDRIRAIFGLTSDDPLPESSGEHLARYYRHLFNNLEFPFQALYWQEIGPFRTRKYKITVNGLTDIDDYYLSEDYGLSCKVQYNAESKETIVVVQCREKRRRSLFTFLLNLFGVSTEVDKLSNHQEPWLPLDEIEVKKPGRNRQLVSDYSYWFHNY